MVVKTIMYCDVCEIDHNSGHCPHMTTEIDVDAEEDFIDEMVQAFDGEFDG